MKNNRQGERILAGINKNLREKNWKCLYEGCGENAINSHILQRNGILSSIAPDGHLYEVKPSDEFSWGAKKFTEITQFKRIGLNKCHSYPTLCNKHDTAVFLPIETHPLDFENRKVNLLFGLRVLLSFMRKEEIVLEREKRMLNSSVLGPNISGTIVELHMLKNIELHNLLAETRKEQYKALIKNVSEERSDLKYVHLVYPLKESYCSSIHLSPVSGAMVCLNLLPYNSESHLLILYQQETEDTWMQAFIESWTSLTEVEFEYRVSQHLVLQCENWGISESVYNLHGKEGVKVFSEAQMKNMFHGKTKLDVEPQTKFNLFAK